MCFGNYVRIDNMPKYDIIIIGAGPAGLTAGLYAARAGMKVLLLEQALPGGQMLLTETIENFPGFPQGITGQKLAEQFKAQTLQSGGEIVYEQAREIVASPSSATLKAYTVKTTAQGYLAYSVILASGAVPRRLGVAGEEALTGRGVSYCATCDGPLFRQRSIVVVGGGNAAAEEALYLSKFARKVTLIHRRQRLRADQILQDRLRANPKIDFIFNCIVVEIKGKVKIEAVILEDVNTGEKKGLSCEGVFTFVGFLPNTDFVQALVQRDAQGFIITEDGLSTSRKGIFACGDCRRRPLRQVVTACGEAAQAAEAAREYVEQLKGIAYEQEKPFST